MFSYFSRESKIHKGMWTYVMLELLRQRRLDEKPNCSNNNNRNIFQESNNYSVLNNFKIIFESQNKVEINDCKQIIAKYFLAIYFSDPRFLEVRTESGGEPIPKQTTIASDVIIINASVSVRAVPGPFVMTVAKVTARTRRKKRKQ